MISLVAFFTWVKFLLKFRVSKTFGPLFKMMYQMTIALLKFLVFWFVMILCFSCVALLVFTHTEDFHTMRSSFTFFLLAGLGSFDLTVFDVKPEDGADEEVIKNATALAELGVIFMIVYLFINLILMLNFVIAILSEVFSQFTD